MLSQKIALLISLIAIDCTIYFEIRSLINSILIGNVSKTNIKKIKKNLSFKEKFKQKYIFEYAKRYQKELRFNIKLKKICGIYCIIKNIIFFVLIVCGVNLDVLLKVFFVHLTFYVLPFVIYFFTKGKKGDRKIWIYQVKDYKDKK